MVLLGVVLFGTRRAALLGMMAGVLYLTQGQQFTVLGFNLYAVRFLELAGFIRVLARHEVSFGKLNGVDRALLWTYGYTAIIYAIRSDEANALLAATATDAYLCYFTFRGLLANIDEFREFLNSFVVLLVPYVILIVIERIRQSNPFAFMGGVENNWLRDGKMRCEASFRHPSLLGGFGATLLPLYLGLFFGKERRGYAALGIVMSIAMVWASNSGGPKVTAIVALLAWACWMVRGKMRVVRWGIIIGMGLLALVMEAPVWYFPTHFDSLTGGDAWHRAFLIDTSFRHIGSWWLAGMPVSETHSWFAHVLGTGAADITNQFIFFGISAGLGALGLFIFLLIRAFTHIGKALQVVRDSHNDPGSELLLWGMGAMMAAHIANWWGISYWDQMYVVWFMHLAAISAISESLMESPPITAVSFPSNDSEPEGRSLAPSN